MPRPVFPLPASATIETLPLGVVKLRGFLDDEAVRRLFDTAMIAGWDHRVSGAADSWYTKAHNAPDILLHWNYYSPPLPDRRH